MNTRETTFKVVFVGDSGVGKTSLIRAFMGENVENVESTIGIDFHTIVRNDKKIVIWDFAGQEWFREIIVNFISGAFVVVMVFDLSRPKTLINLVNEWAKYVQELNKDAYVIVVGNKSDIKTIDDLLIHEALEELKKSLNIVMYIQTSAVRKENVSKVFDTILELVELFVKIKQKRR